MKDLKYLLLLIAIVAFAHATKKDPQDKAQAKFLPDIPDVKEQKQNDSVRIGVLNPVHIIPASFN